MKRAHCVIVRTWSCLTGHAGAWVIGLAVVWMASVPRPAWGQCNWSGGSTSCWTLGNVGIGTTTPGFALDVATNLSQSPSGGTNLRGSDGHFVRLFPSLAYLNYNSLVQPGDSAIIYSGGTYTNGSSGGSFVIAPWANATSGIRLDSNGNVGIGTAYPGTYKLAVEGNIGARDIIVTNSPWSDYVFEPGYHLRSLSEVNSYIQANHHLPEIPSEAEVKQKGVSVSEMQSKLLAKVEELTLHMIRQENENRELRERIARLEKGEANGATPTAAK
jgi:hypothetical protein